MGDAIEVDLVPAQWHLKWQDSESTSYRFSSSGFIYKVSPSLPPHSYLLSNSLLPSSHGGGSTTARRLLARLHIRLFGHQIQRSGLARLSIDGLHHVVNVGHDRVFSGSSYSIGGARQLGGACCESGPTEFLLGCTVSFQKLVTCQSRERQAMTLTRLDSRGVFQAH